MPLKLTEKYLSKFINSNDYSEIQPQVDAAFDQIVKRSGAGNDFLGWLDLPEKSGSEEIQRIKAAAENIKNSCDVFIVIGIGGSYLGARAAIDFIRGARYNLLNKKTPDIYFAGNDLNSQTISDLLEICEGRDVCLNVISKSGTTTEPAIAFRIFREFLEQKYGQSAREHIFVTTDKSRGKLKELSDAKGYETFVVPDDVGGRYSVLTPVGLLPIAVAGADIDDILAGALEAKKTYTSKSINSNDCCKYAAIRNILYRQGKKCEILASYDNSLSLTAEWWKQLYGESEGKNGKGIFPASVSFTTDLHSLGQFIQEGSRILFETVLDVKNQACDITIPFDPENSDSLNYIAGKGLGWVNSKALEATAIAHTEGGVPNIILELDSRSTFDFGFLVYFFELACAISGYILGVNPFDQPGVEAYKKNMFALLGKQGADYDQIRAKLKDKNI